MSSLYTTDFILNNIYTNGKLIYKGIVCENFRKLLQLALSKPYLKFNGSIYKQKKGFRWAHPPRQPLQIFF